MVSSLALGAIIWLPRSYQYSISTNLTNTCAPLLVISRSLISSHHWPLWQLFSSHWIHCPLQVPFHWATSHVQYREFHSLPQRTGMLDQITVLLLTHLGRVMHICVSKLTIIGSDNGLSPDRRQAIIWTNEGILLIGPLGTNASETLIEIHTFSFKKMHLKMSSGRWRPYCLGLNVLTGWLTHWGRVTHICIGKITRIGSDNGLSPGRRQAIIWTNAGILLIRTLGTKFSKILSATHTFSFKKIHLKMSSGKWRPFCLGLNVLMA